MAYLSYISDELLENYTQEVLDRVLKAYRDSDSKMHSNVVDPFSALFDTLRQGITFDEWLVQERSRQVQKTLQNAVGEFHQNILGSVEGWVNPGRGGGYDIVNSHEKIVGEIKNKFNTMNSSSAASTYRKMAGYIDGELKGFTAYVIFIVPKGSDDFDSPWSPNKETMPLREDLRKTDGESFYAKVTGMDDSLEELFDVLPDVITNLLNQQPLSESERAFLKELFIRAYK